MLQVKPALHSPVATGREQLMQPLDQANRCQVRKPATGAGPEFFRTIASRRVDLADVYDGQVMSRVWKQLSAAGHIAFYQSCVHGREILDGCLAHLPPGEKIALVLDLDDGVLAGNGAGKGYFTHLTEVMRLLEEVAADPRVKIGYLSSCGDQDKTRQALIKRLKSAGFPAVTKDSVKIATKASPEVQQLEKIGAGCRNILFVTGRLLTDPTSGFKIYGRGLPGDNVPAGEQEQPASDPGRYYIMIPNPGHSFIRKHITPATMEYPAQTEVHIKSELQCWDDPEVNRDKTVKPHPMTAQLKQALHYAQSADYDALTTQICQSASLAFGRLTKNKDTRNGVVVMDIDGTVMNNGPWLAGLCDQGLLTSMDSLSRWAMSKQAKAIKGVVELLGVYRNKGLPVVFVSDRNRGLDPDGAGDEVTQATKEHLQALGLFEDGDEILLKGKFPGKTAGGKPDLHKRHRFDAIRQGLVIPGRTEIIQIVGDDPGDLEIETKEFYNVDSKTWPSNIREEIGTKRILMSNPLFYRGWYPGQVNHWKSLNKPEVTRPAAMAAMNRLELGSGFPKEVFNGLDYLL